MAKTHALTDTAFATKPALAVQMITRAIAADVPFAWVAAGSVYGVGYIEQALRRAGKGNVLACRPKSQNIVTALLTRRERMSPP